MEHYADFEQFLEMGTPRIGLQARIGDFGTTSYFEVPVCPRFVGRYVYDSALPGTLSGPFSARVAEGADSLGRRTFSSVEGGPQAIASVWEYEAAQDQGETTLTSRPSRLRAYYGNYLMLDEAMGFSSDGLLSTWMGSPVAHDAQGFVTGALGQAVAHNRGDGGPVRPLDLLALLRPRLPRLRLRERGRRLL